MKSRYVVGAILAAALVWGAVHYYGGSQVPSGQTPLQALTPQSIAGIKGEFNASGGDVRVLVLLSPT